MIALPLIARFGWYLVTIFGFTLFLAGALVILVLKHIADALAFLAGIDA